MQLAFSDTTNRQGIIQACEDNCLLGATGISGNSTLLGTFTRNINKRLSIIWSWIFFSYGGIQFEDANQTDLPYSTDTLTSGKRIYANPSGAEAIKGVAYKDASGNYIPLDPITFEQIKDSGYTLDSFYSTSGSPLFYMPVGESIYIFPASNATRSSGFKVYQDRGMLSFATTDTTKVPGFSSSYHEAVPTGASIDWLQINKPESRSLQELKLGWTDYEVRIKKFYREKFEEMFPPRLTVRDATLEAQ